jgi:hypothetical protein
VKNEKLCRRVKLSSVPNTLPALLQRILSQLAKSLLSKNANARKTPTPIEAPKNKFSGGTGLEKIEFFASVKRIAYSKHIMPDIDKLIARNDAYVQKACGPDP